MKSLIKSLRGYKARVSNFRRIMPLGEALRCARKVKKEQEWIIHLNQAQRPVTIRLGTSDVLCLEKVFLDLEDPNPFEIKPKFIIDAGANIGLATLFFAHQYPNAHIVAIEPEDSNFQLLKKNCEHLPNITLIKAALWSSEMKPLKIANPQSDKWAFSVSEANGLSTALSPIVEAVTPLGLLAKFHFDRIDVLKLDIEGAERELFKLNAETWLGSVGQIIVELHDRFFPGCSQSFYNAVTRLSFAQEIRGENIFIQFMEANGA